MAQFSENVNPNNGDKPSLWGTETSETEWRRWARLFGKDLVGIIPPDAATAPHLRENRGKIPGYRANDGAWFGRRKPLKGPEAHSSKDEIRKWAADCAGIGIMGNTCVGLDNDASDVRIRDGLREIIHKHGCVGPRRGRPNSIRDLHMVTAPGLAPWQIRYRPPGKSKGDKPDLLELKASGTYYNVEGPHPTRCRYTWDNGHPCEVGGAGGLPKADKATMDAIYAEAVAYLTAQGCEIVDGSTKTGSGGEDGPAGKRTALDDDPRRHDEAGALIFMALYPNSREAFPYYGTNTPAGESRKDALTVEAALWTALGPDREQHRGRLLEWHMGDPNNTEERFDANLAKFDREGTSVGAEFLYGFPRMRLYADAKRLNEAQEAFADDVPPEYRDDGGREKQAGAEASKPKVTWKTAEWVDLPDEADIAPRQFVYKRHFIRDFLSVTFAQGGVGKSSLTLAEAACMTTGRPLLGDTPKCRPDGTPLHVLVWNGEDPEKECKRKAVAIAKHYGLRKHEIGCLCLLSGRDAPLVIASNNGREGLKVNKEAVDHVRDLVQRLDIDVMIFDPFVSMHSVSENDNTAIDTVAKKMAAIADEFNCALHIVHHTRKAAPGQTTQTADDGRGAAAFKDAARSTRTANKMTKEEAAASGVPENERWRYFRVFDGDKTNLAPPSEKSEWYRLASVELNNGDGLYDPDNIGVATRWTWPELAAVVEDALTPEAIAAIQAKVGSDGRWSPRPNAYVNWIGIAVAEAMKRDIKAPGQRAWAKAVADKLMADGYLVEAPVKKNRKASTGVFVGKAVAA